MNPKPCWSCGATIAFIVSKNGKKIPVNWREHPIVIVTPAGEVVSGFESHFATCPNADQHRKSKEAAE